MSGDSEAIDFARLRVVFTEALEHPDDGRDAFVDRSCAGDDRLAIEVRRLLEAHAHSGSMFEESTSPGEQPGDLMGPYELVERIGEGGFGVVWVAAQHDPIARRVALKIVKPGMDSREVLARFEVERRALALMDHPNIARVLDAGATELGRPFFVMELVTGVPVLEYCDRACLPTAGRLELFGQVCAAVQHAHHKGVVHRDLKPTNVMVTLVDGQPVCKVIDFGIAKAIRSKLVERTEFTAHGRFVGTPEYMAPEQSELSDVDVDTRADVYSLGVLLYELLVGARPLEVDEQRARGYLEMLRVVRDVDPARPSTRLSALGNRSTTVAEQRGTTVRHLGSLLRGELDWIVMRALEKDRDHRYQTVAEFADDVRRFLEDEPVRAGPPSRRYRIRKFVRRHRRAVAVGSFVLCSLVAGLGMAAWGWSESRLAKNRAERSAFEATTAAHRSERVVDLLGDLLSASNPHAMRGADVTVRELLDEFDSSIVGGLRGQPELEAELRLVVGSSFVSLGLPSEAERQFEQAWALRREMFGTSDLRTVEAAVRVAGAAFAKNELDRAATMFEAALAVRERELGRQH
ncbi:MAG: serine/threonine protein kinase, partial [Planctomycetes bacterium]|nr:serine/threonine protein kinase [Planctomycetota bacterium]